MEEEEQQEGYEASRKDKEIVKEEVDVEDSGEEL